MNPNKKSNNDDDEINDEKHQECNILINCGLNIQLLRNESQFNDLLDQLHKLAPNLSAILLTYPDTNHIGLLPFIVTKCTIKCPIYSTVPIYNFGQLFLYDFHESITNIEKFDLYTLDDVDLAFEAIHKLKYLQNIIIDDVCTAYPLNSGHMMGGSIWRLILNSGENIVYSLSSNHRMEYHLDQGALNSLDFRPNILICDVRMPLSKTLSMNSSYSNRQSGNNMLIDKQKMNTSKILESTMIKEIQETLRKGGNVMMPCDTAGRVIELSYILNKEWSKLRNNLISYNLVLLSPVAYNVIEFAKAHVEWCGKRMSKEIEKNHQNPLNMNFIMTCHNLEELEKIPKPIVLMVSSLDLEIGFSRLLFAEWSQNPLNKIIFTQQPQTNDINEMENLSNFLINNQDASKVEINIYSRELINEDEVFNDKNLLFDSNNNYFEANQSNKIFVKNIMQSKASNNDVNVEKAGNSTINMKKTHQTSNLEKNLMMDDMSDIMMIKQIKNPFTSKISYPCFAYVSNKVRWDDYGEINEDFVGILPESHDQKTSNDSKDKHEKKLLQEIFKDMQIEKSRKYTYSVRKEIININCDIRFIDFTGISDYDSFKRIISRLRPEKLILSSNEPQTINLMQNFISMNLSKSCKFFCPQNNEIIQIHTDANFFYTNLTREILNNLTFHSILNNLSITKIKGRISCSDIHPNQSHYQSLSHVLELSTNQDKHTNYLLQEKSNHEIQHKIHDFEEKIYFGAPKLSTLKSIIVKSGMSTEFLSGSLIVKNKVALCKKEGNTYVMEGYLCPEYFKTRSLLYSHLVDA